VIKDVALVGWIHDELGCCCRPEVADEVGAIMVRWAKEAGEHYKFRCALDADYKVGRSWAGDIAPTAGKLAASAAIEVPPAAPEPPPLSCLDAALNYAKAGWSVFPLGVRRAMSGLFTGLDLANAVKQGVRDGLQACNIEEAIRQGIGESFPYPSEIQEAIWDGAREAVAQRKR
jgi:hypothetical protein